MYYFLFDLFERIANESIYDKYFSIKHNFRRCSHKFIEIIKHHRIDHHLLREELVYSSFCNIGITNEEDIAFLVLCGVVLDNSDREELKKRTFSIIENSHNFLFEDN